MLDLKSKSSGLVKSRTDAKLVHRLKRCKASVRFGAKPTKPIVPLNKEALEAMTKTIVLIPPPAKGERKQVEREALEEDGEEEIVRVLLGLVVREEAVVDSNIRLWNTTVDPLRLRPPLTVVLGWV
ncbi:hypothetical protein NC653_001680 [Populus alba x Populus x berolinensis]|uniref:Uncharacterized protein n=4 Tax=Populus TaxID=3689 RepID=A0A4U5NPJ4_POPAL|nr:hypothetical protein NC653_001680 [Populus alba x Populus x berolinensis]TKR85567.1 hypothetical protein D5086_0000247090 [Populus alba]